MNDFTKASADKYSIFQSFIKFAKSTDFLCQFYKKRLKIKAMHFYALDNVWNKQFMNITQNNILGKSKTKKISKLMKKIYSISDDTKYRVLKLFMELCTLRFKIWFAQHRRSIAEKNQE